MTPRLDGSDTRRLSHPPFHVLLLVPFKWLGSEDLTLPYVLAHGALVLLMFLTAPRAWRPLVLLPLFINPEYLDFPGKGVSDGVWSLLLVLMALCWRRPALRAILFGLACAYKQTPWLLAPFIVVRLLVDGADADPRRPIKRVLHFTLWVAATFLFCSVPFLWPDPGPLWLGMTDPMRGHLVYLGTGLVSLTQLGLVALPKAFYSLVSLGALAGLLVLYAIHFHRLRELMWLGPVVVLWLSYRSLQSYYVYWLPPLIVALLQSLPREALAEAEVMASGRDRGRLKRLSLAVAAALALGGVLAITTWPRAGGLQLELVELEVAGAGGDVTSLSATLTNKTSRPVSPRFAVQNASWQPLPWRIVSGPDQLLPGGSARYQIRTDVAYQRLRLAEGGQVVVSDASGDYALRGLLPVPPDRSFGGREGPYNSGYLRGTGRGSVPWGWRLDGPSGRPPVVQHLQTPIENAIELGLVPGPAAHGWQAVTLSQSQLFPSGEVCVWLAPPSDASAQGLNRAYGLELADPLHRIWVLFGPGEPSQGLLGPSHAYVSQPMPAGTWSERCVDVGELYGRLGWELPPLQMIARPDGELLTRPLRVGLLVAGRDLPPGVRMTGRFGRVRMRPAPVHERIRRRLETRHEYYRALAGLARSRGNLSRARELEEKLGKLPAR
jgi:hypothetical protein